MNEVVWLDALEEKEQECKIQKQRVDVLKKVLVDSKIPLKKTKCVACQGTGKDKKNLFCWQ